MLPHQVSGTRHQVSLLVTTPKVVQWKLNKNALEKIHPQNFETKNHRNDNLVEIWFESGKQQQPKQGWIESKIVNAYYNNKLMLLEDYHLKAIEITKNLVIL